MRNLLDALRDAALRAEIHGAEGKERQFRLITLLADGADHMAARAALERDWPVVAPLPFGVRLNTAINAEPQSETDARAILSGQAPENGDVYARAQAIEELAEAVQVFELADEDDAVERAYLAACGVPDHPAAISTFAHLGSRRASLAGRILIEQSDILIAVWDGASTDNPGGTGHTTLQALEAGVPVVWIDPARPMDWCILHSPEQLADLGTCPTLDRDAENRSAALDHLVAESIGLPAPDQDGAHTGLSALDQSVWRDRSSITSHGYRRIEALFGEDSWRRKLGSVRQHFERPERIADGSAKPLVDSLSKLSGENTALMDGVKHELLPRLAWANEIGARLSNLYRSGMVTNFTLGAMAIIAGVLYLPLVETSQKWIFAGIELALLLAILINTVTGQKARLHGRWLETRRAAEYLRHAPALLALGIARPAGSWPAGLRSAWPEWYAKRIVRQMGLPPARIDKAYLRKAASVLQEHFIVSQRDYHIAKSARLHAAHSAIERLAERLFVLAVIVVALYLAAFGASRLGLIEPAAVTGVAKWFTVIAVALPTISGALAAIAYFGDFDRFADVSRMTAQKLDGIADRVARYIALPDESLTYSRLADLARLTDETTFAEIQAWQAVFSGKRTTVPA